MSPDFTTVVALDLDHLRELALVCKTWARNKQEIYWHELLCFCDDIESEGWWRRKIAWMTGHPNFRIVLWPAFDGIDQRQRMLAAFTWGVAEFCETDFHFKVDTDSAAMPDPRPWPDPTWFDEKAGYVFIGRKWGYTRPAQMYLNLVSWARTVPAFDGTEEAPGKWTDPLGKCRHGRIISHSMFGRTSFAKELAAMADAPGPVPSHDTWWWYVAHRLGRPYLRLKDSQGFSHGARRLAERCRAAVE